LGMVIFLVGILSFSWKAWDVTLEETAGLRATEAQEAVPTDTPKAKRLLDLLVSTEPDGTRAILVGDGEIPSYNAFTLKDPARIVLDIWDVGYDPQLKKIAVKTREVASVRIARYPEKVRVVFDAAESKKGVIPPFSLKRETGKLVLCVGEMARGEQSDPGAPPVRVEPKPDTGQGLPAEATSTQGQVARVEVEKAAPEEQQIAESAAAQVPQRPAPVTEPERAEETKQEMAARDAQPQVPVSETAPAKEEEISVAAHATVTAPAFAPVPAESAPVESLARGPSAKEEGPLEAGEASPSLSRTAPVGPGPSAIPVAKVTEEEIVSSGQERASSDRAVSRQGPAQAPSATAKASSRPPYGDKRAKADVVSLAQISAKAESRQEREEEEQEEEFRIITGMEPGRDYRGQRMVDLDFQDIELENVFRLLAEVSNFNIVVSEKVKGKITMRLKNVPWGQAMDLVVSTQKLGMVQQGNVIRVAPLKDLIDEEKERRTLRQQKLQEKLEAARKEQEEKIAQQEREKKLRPFVTETIQLNYAKVKSVVDDQIKKGKLLTDERELKRQGMVFYDEKTNQLTVTDYPEVIEEIKRYVQRVDKPTPQVLIEARVVKANKTFSRELGIQWGGQFAEFERANEWAMGISGGLGGAAPSTWRSRGFVTPGTTQFLPNSSWMVNLPATLFGASTPAIGFQIGKLLGDLINLDLRLSAAEQDGLTKIISRPKVMTLDNVEATIEQGRDMPYTQVNPEGQTSVVWKRASLKTNVTPLISPDGRVKMKIHVTDNRVDPTVTSSLGEPSILIREAGTEVLVRNGETVVIGGIVEETKTKAEQGVPWLKDTPILNWLFERKAVEDRLDEMLIFVTPFVIEAG
jgi:type IV pilus secretin PilQ/predicted competence protein